MGQGRWCWYKLIVDIILGGSPIWPSGFLPQCGCSTVVNVRTQGNPRGLSGLLFSFEVERSFKYMIAAKVVLASVWYVFAKFMPIRCFLVFRVLGAIVIHNPQKWSSIAILVNDLSWILLACFFWMVSSVPCLSCWPLINESSRTTKMRCARGLWTNDVLWQPGLAARHSRACKQMCKSMMQIPWLLENVGNVDASRILMWGQRWFRGAVEGTWLLKGHG